jgi:hypothetical protein
MKQRKIAISLTVVGAVAGPFVLGTNKMHPMVEVLVPLSAEEKENISALLKETNNCPLTNRLRELEDLGVKVSVDSVDWNREFFCRWNLKKLQAGGEYKSGFSAPKYLALNAAAALAGFGTIFGLTYLLPALVRRYWRWLNT